MSGCAICGFSEDRCLDGRFQPASPGTMRFTFENVPVGMYAVAAYHDINMDEPDGFEFHRPSARTLWLLQRCRASGAAEFSRWQRVPVTPQEATIDVRLARMGRQLKARCRRFCGIVSIERPAAGPDMTRTCAVSGIDEDSGR